jgi:tetratricopeptide (TPR) repeat protein
LREPGVLLRLSAIFLAALYVRTVTYGFVYDDLGIVFIQWKGWAALKSLFLHDLFASASGTGSDYYRPLSSALGIIFVHWTGGTPGWFHLAAVAIHVTAFYLAYLFGRHLFRSEWMALLTAFFYSIHPAKVEPVAWVGSSWCDGIGALFFFASLICYFKWRETSRNGWIAGSLLFYAACLLTKETLAVLPGLIAVHFWLSETSRQKIRKSFLLLLPYAIAIAGYFVLRHIALTPHVVSAGVGKPYLKPSFTATNIWSAPLACWWYVQHLVWPTGLAVMYDSIIVTTPKLWNFVAPGIALLLSGGIGIWIWLRHRSVEATVMVAFFVLTMAPYIVLAPMAQQHDRYLYLASYPFAALIAWLLLAPSRVPARARYAIGLLLIASWAASTWHETGFWVDNLSLWQRASVIAPNSVRPKVVLADEYALAGNLPAAEEIITEGLNAHPASAYLLYSQAALAERRDDLTKAKSGYERAFTADSFGNLKPICASKVGNLAMKEKDYAEAERWYRIATTLAPQTVGYHGALAKALHAQGRETEAAEQYRLEVQVSTAIRRAANSL